jgi:ribosomal protein L40E
MPIVLVSVDVIVGSPFEQDSFRVNDREVDMNHLETLESVERVICDRCGNAYAPDADECSRCGAVSHTAPRNKGSVNDSEAWTGRHPRRLRRAHESSPYPSIQEEVVPPCVARNAAHVQALDTSNAESRVMLSNAVVKIGWAGGKASTAPNGPAQASAQPRADNQ